MGNSKVSQLRKYIECRAEIQKTNAMFRNRTYMGDTDCGDTQPKPGHVMVFHKVSRTSGL